MKIIRVHDNWAFIILEETSTLQRRKAYKDLKWLEAQIPRTRAIVGWVCESRKYYTGMHKILKRLGAEIYAEDDESYYFKKEIRHGVKS